MLSRYGFGFEEKGENEIYYSINPSVLGWNYLNNPIYIPKVGFVHTNGGVLVGALSEVRFWGQAAARADNVSRFTFYNARVYPNVDDVKWFGFSLCYGAERKPIPPSSLYVCAN